MVELFEPPVHLYTELERLEYEMKRFFPYLSPRSCIELNHAIKSIQKTELLNMKNKCRWILIHRHLFCENVSKNNIN